VREVTGYEAEELLDDGAVLIDVRQPEEFDAGHAPMAESIPLMELADHLDELPRDRVVICACRTGGRSSRAAQFLAEHGFDAVNLAGGMVAWVHEDRDFESDGGDPTVL
jgi:rhodanese-related sulfurtransferase